MAGSMNLRHFDLPANYFSVSVFCQGRDRNLCVL